MTTGPALRPLSRPRLTVVDWTSVAREQMDRLYAAEATRWSTVLGWETASGWQEVERGVVGPRTFTLRTIAARVGEVGELWSAMHDHGHSLRGPMTKLEEMLTEDDWREALAATTRTILPTALALGW